MSSNQTPKRTPRTDRLLGTVIAGKYKILKKIGEGGMGSVYIANQDPIDRKVAVKVLLSKLAEDEVAVKRFEQEAKAISRMQHPNTVTIYDFGRTADDDEERLYIVMEYLRGQTLTQVLRQDGQLHPRRAARIMRQVCASLGDAHAAGIIHRDLKPDNIFLTEVGGDKDWVKVLDFGVAKLADSEGAGTLTQTGMIFGTPKYMSPEQAEGRPIDYRADIYALGVVLYELLVGRPPFLADTPVGLLLKHISEPPPPFKQVRADLDIDPMIEAITMRALDKRPEGRQQVVAELAAELEGFERSASGAVSVPGLNTMATGPAGLPTEVNPGQQAQMTPRDLAPPDRLPSGLSLGDAAKVEGQGPAGSPVPTGETGLDAPGYEDASGRADSGGPARDSRLMTAQGITHPTPAHGGGIETLGGLSGEFDGRRRAPRQSSVNTMMMTGVVFLVAAAVLAAYVLLGQRDKVQAESVAGPPPASSLEPAPEPEDPATESESETIDEASADAEARRAREERKEQRRRRAAADALERLAEPPPPPPPPMVSQLTDVEFTSAPAGAIVALEGGRQLGLTPVSISFKRGERITVVFSKRGFVSKKRAFTVGQGDIEVRLAKRQTCPDGSSPPCRAEEAPPPVVERKATDVILDDLKVDELK